MEKPQGWYNGTVDIWHLPGDVRILVDTHFCSDIIEKGKQIAGNYTELARKIREPLSKRNYPYTILKFKYENTHKVSLVRKLVEFINLEGFNHEKIHELSSCGRKREKILNPRMPFNFNSVHGSRLIAAFLFDGCIKAKSLNPNYWNKEKILRKRVLEDLRAIFGSIQTKTNIKNFSLDFPKICGLVLVNGIGMIPGNKVVNNPQIPHFIFNLPEECISAFLQQAFDDDGTVGKDSVRIGLSKLDNKEPHYLLIGIKKLLKKLGIDVRGPYKDKTYPVGLEKHARYTLNITSRDNMEIFAEKINFIHRKKKRKLKTILNKKPKERHFSWGTVTEMALKKMQNLQNKHGYFTRKMLAKELNRTFGRSQQLFHTFRKKGLITEVGSYSGRRAAKFVLNKLLRVIIDTNMFLVPAKYKVDIFAELMKFGKPELYTLDLVVQELKKLAKGRGQDARHARLALTLVKKKHVTVLGTKNKSADKEIERIAAEQNMMVCTQDRELIKRLKAEEIPVVSLKQKKYLALV